MPPQSRISRDVRVVHDCLRAPLALPMGDPRRFPVLMAALLRLTTLQRKLLTDRLLADDLIRNYQLLYDPSFPPITLQQENAPRIQDSCGNVDYDSTHCFRYMCHRLVGMTIGEEIAGAPLRIVPQWIPDITETDELRGFEGNSKEVFALEQRRRLLHGERLSGDGLHWDGSLTV